MRYIYLLLMACLSFHAYGQEILQFKTSKPAAVLNFLETITGRRGTSSTLKAFIQNSKPAREKEFEQMVALFNGINLDYNYQLPGYPKERHSFRSTHDIIQIAAVQSSDVADLCARINGILPNSEWQNLCVALRVAEGYYDKIIGEKNLAAVRGQMARFDEYKDRMAGCITKLNVFYNSTFTSSATFTICGYPIPGGNGMATATPHGTTLILGMFTDEKLVVKRAGVAIHELCHVLYDGQSGKVQQTIDSLFNDNPSPYNKLAYRYFDEALATACGNGWAYSVLTGSEDTGQWYADRYINDFAKALYPMVKQYISRGNQLDAAFVDEAIQLFAQRFPSSVMEYATLLNTVYFYGDFSDQEERNSMLGMFQHGFGVGSSYISSPIRHEQSLESIKTSQGAQFIIVDRDHEANFAALRPIFSQLMDVPTDKDLLISFLDAKRRLVVIVAIHDKSKLGKALSKMKEKKAVDPQQLYFMLE